MECRSWLDRRWRVALVIAAAATAGAPGAVSAQQGWAERMEQAARAMNAADWAAAERLLEGVIAEARGWGRHDNRLLVALNRLATVYRRTQRVAAAESLYLDIRDRYAERDGPGHPNVASALLSLASLYEETNRGMSAESLYLRALAIDQAALGTESAKVATTLNALASLYLRRGDFSAADTLFERALAVNRAPAVADEDAAATVLNNLGIVKQNLGDLVAAESLFTEAIAAREQAGGPLDPQLLPALNNLAAVKRMRQQYAAAESLYVRALHAGERAYGPNHPNLAPTLANLALTHERQGKPDEAEAEYRRTLDLYEQGRPVDRLYGLVSENLGTIYYIRARYPEAEQLLLAAIETYERVGGPSRQDLVRTLRTYAALLLLSDHRAEARQVAERADSLEKRQP
jgi:tetratricopeptide (TPR) repeat protein